MCVGGELCFFNHGTDVFIYLFFQKKNSVNSVFLSLKEHKCTITSCSLCLICAHFCCSLLYYHSP